MAAAMVLSSCSSSDREAPADSNESATSAAASPSAARESTGASDEDLLTYFQAVAHPVRPKVRAALKVTEPGSPAALYITHQAALEQALTDAGSPSEPDELSERDGVFVSCAATEDDCARYGNIESEGDKLSAFTVQGKSIEGRLLPGRPRTYSVGGLAKARLISAYRARSGDLFATLDVRNVASSPISFESRTAYIAANGRQANVAGSYGPTALMPGSRATYALTFSGASLGGTLHVEMYSESGAPSSGGVDIELN